MKAFELIRKIKAVDNIALKSVRVTYDGNNGVTYVLGYYNYADGEESVKIGSNKVVLSLIKNIYDSQKLNSMQEAEIFLKELIKNEAIAEIKKSNPFVNASDEDVNLFLHSVKLNYLIVSALDMALDEYKSIFEKYSINVNEFKFLKDKARQFLLKSVDTLGVENVDALTDEAELLLKTAENKIKKIDILNKK